MHPINNQEEERCNCLNKRKGSLNSSRNNQTDYFVFLIYSKSSMNMLSTTTFA
jgi:hypothetical protein